MMTNEQFDALVARLENEARSNPGRYQLKVLLLAWLGNAYLGLMLCLIGGVIVALMAMVAVLKALAVKLILVAGVFLWGVLKALWVKIEPPTGFEVSASQAPQLHAMLTELRRALKAPRFHHVLVVDDFNAAVAQVPRLGIFGWPSNYLLLGLPLMKTLTVEQFKAVLAHELGHLSGGHGRMGHWIYRQRLRWSRLMQELESKQSWGSFLFKPFLKWFAPYFNAYSFPLARANEYEADAVSARLTSPQIAATALTSVDVVGSYLSERYWPRIFKQADDQPHPNFAPYRSMGHGVATELDDEAAQTWLAQAMRRQTTSVDTHPALADRLHALGMQPQLCHPAAGQAADSLLGAALLPLTERFDQRWAEHIGSAWEGRHREVQHGRHQLAALNERVAGGAELSLQEAYERAKLTDSVGQAPDEALAQFRALHERAPDEVLACYALGSRLLERDEEAGVALLQRAMELDDDAIAPACELLRDYCWRHDRQDEAHSWHQRLLDRVAVQQGADKERNQLLASDKFEPHGLPASQQAELLAALRRVPGLRRAYLVRKRVLHLTHRPCYVLGYGVTPFWQWHSRQRAAEVLQSIQQTVRFPGETLIVNIEGGNASFGRKFRWARGSRLI